MVSLKTGLAYQIQTRSWQQLHTRMTPHFSRPPTEILDFHRIPQFLDFPHPWKLRRLGSLIKLDNCINGHFKVHPIQLVSKDFPAFDTGQGLIQLRSALGKKVLEQSHHLQECSRSFANPFDTIALSQKSKMATVNDVCSLATILTDLCDDTDTNFTLHTFGTKTLLQMCRK